MASDRSMTFLATLREELRDQGIQEAELADWLNTSASTISRRLNGRSEFSREEVAILDERLGEHGGLLMLAGFIPEQAELPRSRYFDEQAFFERFEETLLLSLNQATPIAVAERSLRRLLSYLRSVEQTHTVRRYALRLEFELLDRVSNRAGVTPAILRAARDLQRAVEAHSDRSLAFEYEGLLSDLYVGLNDYQRALLHQRKALDLIRVLPDRQADQLDTEVAVARLMTAIDPAAPEIPRILEKAKPLLWVPRYEAWQWPQSGDGPSFLDLLHAEAALQLTVGDMQRAGDTVTLMLDAFMTSPRMSDNIASLLVAADFYARDGQADDMERYLILAEELIEKFGQHWFGDEANVIRDRLGEGHA
jgi:tetratricopeptide (TPR) repeat protein